MSDTFPDLVDIFNSLPVPAPDAGMGRFCAQAISGFPMCAVGKDASGLPALLIEADNVSSVSSSPLVLESLSVIHLVNCRVRADGEESNRTLSIVRCTGADRAIHEYFLRCLHPIVAALPVRPSRDQVNQSVERLVDLFRRMADAPRKAIAGLWAELLLISRSSNPSRLLAAWHAVPEERFDFADGQYRVEVKASLGALRTHHFALEQLRPTGDIVVAIASVLMDRSEGGISITELVDAIRSTIGEPELLIRLDNIVASTLGREWRAGQQVKFDCQVAIDSFRLIDARTIPSVALPLPAEVTSVHFRVDLTRHSMECPHALLRESELFLAIAQAPAS